MKVSRNIGQALVLFFAFFIHSTFSNPIQIVKRSSSCEGHLDATNNYIPKQSITNTAEYATIQNISCVKKIQIIIITQNHQIG